MSANRSRLRGCLLGMAAGDAMGYPVNSKNWLQIQEDYGPHGLMGYDLCNGYAEVTSHTQLAMFTCNGLLLGLTRGLVFGKMAPYVKYVALAQREWAAGQRRYDQPQRTYCWAYRLNELRLRRCVDTRVLDTLNRGLLGSLEEPTNQFETPVGLSAAVAVAVFARPEWIGAAEADRLAAECVALTCGSPIAFLPAAFACHLVSLCLTDSTTPLETLVEQSICALEQQFGKQFSETHSVVLKLRGAAELAQSRNVSPVSAMEHLCDNTGLGAVAGAVYSCLLCQESFDDAMVVAVNHSGPSSAVGMLAGAILGARNAEGFMPDFYLDGLEIAPLLAEMAEDLVDGCPMEQGNRLFDGDWDRKYLHGEY